MAAATPSITMVGNLVDDPELRFTPSGQAVANFTRRVHAAHFSTGRPTSGRTAKACSCAATSGGRRRRTSPSRSSAACRVIVPGPAQAALLRDQGGREAHRLRARGRRGRPLAAERDRQGQQDLPQAAAAAATSAVAAAAPWASAAAAAPQGGGRRRRGRLRRRRRPAAAGGGGSAAAASATNRLSRSSRPSVRRRHERRVAPEIPATSAATIPACDGALKGAPRWPSRHCASRRRRFALFCKDKISYVDYKDTALLRKFISDRGKIRARRVTGNCTQHQRDVATAIKNAARWRCCPTRARRAKEVGRDEAHPHPGGRRPRRARRRRRGQGRVRPQLPGSRAASRWPGPRAARSRSPRSSGPGTPARSRPRHAKEIADRLESLRPVVKAQAGRPAASSAP